MNINNFKAGEKITRVHSSESSNPDCSYIGDKITLVGVVNGLIYINTEEFGRDTLNLSLYSNGWEKYIEVDFPEDTDSEDPIEDFRLLVAKLLKAEDYESLAALKSILNQRAMKNRIKKIIKSYEKKISRTRTEIEALKKELVKISADARKIFDIPKLRELVEEIEDFSTDLKVLQKKEMMLVQARTDFECLLLHAES